MIRRRLVRALRLAILFLAFIVITAPEWPAFGDQAYQLNALVGLRQFDFLVWELNAIGAKGEAILANVHTYLDQNTRKEVALDYLARVSEIRQLEQRIENIYVDPNVADPAAESQDLQAQLARTRSEQRRLQPFVEAIVQDQVADLLVDDGFAFLGEAWPPVMMHMTPLPSILIVSPRDHIERIYGIPLVHGLSALEQDGLEQRVYNELDLSALVVPIGGLGIYPAMVFETGSINHLVDVTAHEWAHHWLAPYPITFKYGTDASVRTINETVASIVGKEIGALVIERYYPEYVPPPEQAQTAEQPAAPEEPPAFDFRAEMAETRLEVDKLLAAGKIGEAESYMEERRQRFVENGYPIRKLNQAYFAFYGAYADEPGASGGDPIGPMLLELRSQSPSLRDFMETVATVGSLEDLQEIVEQLK